MIDESAQRALTDANLRSGRQRPVTYSPRNAQHLYQHPCPGGAQPTIKMLSACSIPKCYSATIGSRNLQKNRRWGFGASDSFEKGSLARKRIFIEMYDPRGATAGWCSWPSSGGNGSRDAAPPQTHPIDYWHRIRRDALPFTTRQKLPPRGSSHVTCLSLHCG
jgi:hypothetical protein